MSTLLETIYSKDIQISSLSEIIEAEDSLLDYQGYFLATAYCSCSKCCGEWAKDRPKLKNKKIVFTASGSIAEQGVTVAVDPKVIPYGTKLYIEGVGVRIAQDCGSAIKGNRLDVYFEDHTEALESSMNDRERRVWIINEGV